VIRGGDRRDPIHTRIVDDIASLLHPGMRALRHRLQAPYGAPRAASFFIRSGSLAGHAKRLRAAGLSGKGQNTEHGRGYGDQQKIFNEHCGFVHQTKLSDNSPLILRLPASARFWN